jgi:aspartate/glutamate racemase
MASGYIREVSYRLGDTFERNTAPVATASSVQVREKAHTRSVGKWKRFARQLEPLRAQLEQGGVEL